MRVWCQDLGSSIPLGPAGSGLPQAMGSLPCLPPRAGHLGSCILHPLPGLGSLPTFTQWAGAARGEQPEGWGGGQREAGPLQAGGGGRPRCWMRLTLPPSGASLSHFLGLIHPHLAWEKAGLCTAWPRPRAGSEHGGTGRGTCPVPTPSRDRGGGPHHTHVSAPTLLSRNPGPRRSRTGTTACVCEIFIKAL